MSSRMSPAPALDWRTISMSCSTAAAALLAWMVVIEPGCPELTLRR